MKPKRSRWLPFSLLILSVICGLAFGIYLGWQSQKIKKTPLSASIPNKKNLTKHFPLRRYPPINPKHPALSTPPTVRKKTFQHKEKPRVAFIIDDLGYNFQTALPFLKIPFPIAVSVLPQLPFSKEVSQEAIKDGKTLLLHLPMEADANNQFLGPGAIFTNMNDETIKKIIEEDLKTVPGVEGLNNHMGSKATSLPRIAKLVALEAKEHHLFVIDSLTTPTSLLYNEARSLHVPTAKREVFLDNETNVPYIRTQVEELAKIAKEKGSGIAIGHPHPQTLEVLLKMVPKLKKEGFDVVPVTQLLQE